MESFLTVLCISTLYWAWQTNIDYRIGFQPKNLRSYTLITAVNYLKKIVTQILKALWICPYTSWGLRGHSYELGALASFGRQTRNRARIPYFAPLVNNLL